MKVTYIIEYKNGNICDYTNKLSRARYLLQEFAPNGRIVKLVETKSIFEFTYNYEIRLVDGKFKKRKLNGNLYSRR